MTKEREKIPPSGFIIFGVLSAVVLGVLPLPFVLINMRLNNIYVTAYEASNQNLMESIEKQMRMCRILIIISVLLELVIFMLAIKRFYNNFDEILSMVMRRGCSDCTGK